jgi:hypothetical protein
MATYQPWNVLLALKWTFQEMDNESHLRPAADQNDIHAVLNILHEMDDKVRMPTDYDHWMLFMRHLAFQQFDLQQGVDGSAIARQHLLFATLPSSHSFQTKFTSLTGLKIADFTLLLAGLLALILSEPPRIAVAFSDLEALRSQVQANALPRFFRAVSRTIPELHDWLMSTNFQNISVGDEKLLPTPLLACPLIADIGRVLIYYPPLLFRALEDFVYCTLRQENPSEFVSAFGPIFERHVSRCLTEAGVPFKTESEINAVLPDHGKCVDFLVVEDECSILIDAKAVEVSTMGRVSHEVDKVVQSMKAYAVKAIAQGITTHRRLASGTTGSSIRWGKTEAFLVVVTYHDLYLGSNRHFAEIYGDKLLPRTERSDTANLPFPLENVFFVSIKEFEDLMALIRDGQTTFLSALRYSKRQDADGNTVKLQFKQHLASLCQLRTRLPCLHSTLESLYARCEAALVSENGSI